MSAYNDIIYGIGDIFTWTFKILPALGNLPNILFSVIMAVMALYWLKWQRDLSAEAKQNGTIE